MSPRPVPDDVEDDYMSMVIEEPTQQRETLTQRKLRKQRESEAKARVPSKAERAAAHVTRREQALSASVLDPTNKGFQMMAKLGFKAGDTLGKKKAQPPAVQQTHKDDDDDDTNTIISNDNSNNHNNKKEGATARNVGSTTTANTQLNDWIQSRAEPLRLIVKEDRGGIGLDSEKKRKFREEADELVSKNARAKAEEGEYRERMRAEREERRLEAQVRAAQMVAEKLDCGDEIESVEEEEKKKQKKKQPASQINVLYRGLVREREEKERERLVRAIFDNSISTTSSSSFFPKPRLPSYNNNAADEHDSDDDDDHGSKNRTRHALQNTEENVTFEEQETDADAAEDDEELNEFNALPASSRLERLVAYMREKYWYCFWCKYRYDEAGMEGCPGLTEEDHD